MIKIHAFVCFMRPSHHEEGTLISGTETVELSAFVLNAKKKKNCVYVGLAVIVLTVLSLREPLWPYNVG